MPKGVDGAWPHEVLRDLIERLESEDFERGIDVGITNSRGFFFQEYGRRREQEREIAGRYDGYAKIVRMRWPRTGRMLDLIADGYRRHAGARRH